jgi:pimeloyl-ACP methyl ester carboxylesterase
MRAVIDGTDIFVGNGGVEWREGQRTLVLQHGAGMNRTIWVLLARYFARHGFNVVAADLPGHGASGGDALQSIEEQAAHLWLLLEALQQSHGLSLNSVVLGGHSMGALVVAEAAAQQSQRIGDLIMFGAGYPMAVAQPLLDAAQANDQAAVDMIAIYSHSFASQLGHNAVAGISVQNSAMALLEQCLPGVLYTDLQACNSYQGMEAVAGSLAGNPAVNCTVLSGDGDRMTPMKSANAVVELTNAHHIVLHDCGHMMMSEQPEQTLQALRGVLA